MSQLNKSLSAPNISCRGPLFHRLLIEQQCPLPYNPKNNNVAPSFISRHISYEQLDYSGFANRSTTVDGIFNSTLSTPKISQNNVQSSWLPTLNASPMETDQLEVIGDKFDETSKISSPVILDNIDLTFRGPTAILHKRNNKRPKNGSERNNYKALPSNCKMNILLLLLIIFAWFVYEQLRYNANVECESIRKDLFASVIGQNEAIFEINECLLKFRSKSDAQTARRSLLAFVGTTGVGKTLCANIIKRHFLPKQIREYDVDMNTLFNADIIRRAAPHLLILDDLTFEKLPQAVKILQSLPEDQWILAITVFNIQETDDFTTFSTNETLLQLIPNELAKLHFDFDMVHFKSFTTKDMQVILDSFPIVYFDLTQTATEWKTHVERHNFEIFGFKGVHAKIIAQSN